MIKRLLEKINLNAMLAIAGCIAAVLVIIFMFWWHKSFQISGNQPQEKTSSLTGQVCEHADRRPVAVMLASDPVARPLSGMAEADMVFEMPVTPDGVTRMMAVFQCQEPKEIGSIRSARQDFIPLAGSMRAIFVHWGGEHDALRELDSGIINNIDALKYDGTVFYRKKTMNPPHNGFTTLDRLIAKAGDLKYSLADTFDGYAHDTSAPERNVSNLVSKIMVNYASPYDVTWIYDTASNRYTRLRASKPEVDLSSGQTVSASTIIIMETVSHPLNDQYISVAVTGQGKATVYQNGIAQSGIWKRGGALDDKIYFYNDKGKEMPFVPGTVWIEIITP